MSPKVGIFKVKMQYLRAKMHAEIRQKIMRARKVAEKKRLAKSDDV